MLFIKKHPKIFCIGLNKTGTTSLGKALKDLGYDVDDQDEAHKLLYHYEQRDFKSIVKYCRKSNAFQDAPFSYLYTFIFLEQAYPNANFILSIRDSADQWYQSLVNYHSKIFGNGKIPTSDDLKSANRPYGRTPYRNFKMRFNVNDNDMYNKKKLINYYEMHNSMVIDYFRFKNNLLVLNLKSRDSYQKFCSFINKPPIYDSFPWENRTNELK